ncbi:MAG: MFS transporter [Thermocrispum sp.]
MSRTGAVALLRGNKAFRSLVVARVVSFTGDSLSIVALMLHVASSTGQAIAVSVLLLVGDFAPTLFSPLSGALSDRFDRKQVMIACELIQCGLLALIALSLPPLPVLLALVAARSLAGQVFQPASRAAMPALVRERDLETANATLGFGTNGAEAVGPLLAAAMLPFLDVSGVLLVDAASFLLAAVLLTGLPALPPSDGQPTEKLLGQARTGLRYLFTTPAVRVITVAFCAVVAFNGIDDVAVLVLAKDDLDAPDSAVGLLLAAAGIGLFAGYALLARFAAQTRMSVLLIAGFAISSIGNLLTGLAWAVAAAFALQTIRGFGLAAMDVASNTLLQRLVPANLLGRVFGNLYGLIGAAAALSYIGGGLLLDATSAPVTFLVAGAGGTLATVWAAVRLRSIGTFASLSPPTGPSSHRGPPSTQ